MECLIRVAFGFDGIEWCFSWHLMFVMGFDRISSPTKTGIALG
jgi:hypothetical protein